MSEKLKTIPFHPYLLLIFFIGTIYIANMPLLQLSYIAQTLFKALYLLVIFLLITQNALSASITPIIGSILIIATFSFDTFPRLLGNSSKGIELNAVIWMILLVVVFILLGFVDKKSHGVVKFLTYVLNITSLVLLIFMGYFYSVRSKNMSDMNTFSNYWENYINENSKCIGQKSTARPDIYLIILDAYGSKEVLQTYYDYDNSHFENELENLGFVVIPGGKTNYNQTRTSLSSLLNMKYHQDDVDIIGAKSVDARAYNLMMDRSLVIENLKKNGYKIISFPSGYSYTINISQDVTYTSPVFFNDFEDIIFAKSIFYPIVSRMLYDNHAEGINYEISRLGSIENNSHPKFVFSHIYAPHPPFVFNESGGRQYPDYLFSKADAEIVVDSSDVEYYRKNYPGQVEYVSNAILSQIKTILAQEDSPIIILMGDHGPASSIVQYQSLSEDQYERTHILNAVYFPGDARANIPEDLTPVNTFRLVFNTYFECDYPLLENHTFVSSYDLPNYFIEDKK